ncbi:glycosyltransferase [Vibrio astriarenae]|uniref:Glycosyltransferase n=1 Tax=Vibrio astriarenae TaxID=1481923 RepID=A0A7Z2T3M3_9VIBR|nr:glycosyltransferase [Vibrio astriarenae]QIA63637.1 glycosyltransferase [Vibrio astriarenae]
MNTNKTTVFHIVQHLAPGGLESLVLDFVTFADPNTDVYVVSLEGTKERAISHWPKLAKYEQKLVFLNKEPGFQTEVFESLKTLFITCEADVVHTHHIGPLLYGGISAKRAGVPVRVHTEHDVWHLSNTKNRFMESLLLKYVQPKLVADANRVGQSLSDMFNYSDLSTIHNGIDVVRFNQGPKYQARKKLNIKQNIKTIGSAGRLEIVKGHDVLIKAMRYVPSHVHLVIAGDGSQKEHLQKLIDAMQLNDRVTLLGRIDDMTTFYQALDLFCLPSRHEGFPLTALEAQACGVPTAVTDVGSSSETLCPESGTLIKPNRVIEMARTLSTAAKKVVATSPRQFIVENNDIRKMIAKYEMLAIKGETA